MKRIRQVTTLISVIALGLCAAVLFTGFSAAASTEEGEVQLNIWIKANEHVAQGEIYHANVGYSNIGTLASPDDTWVSVTLPEDVEFVSATKKDGQDFPPDDINGNVFVWEVGSVPADGTTKHIFLVLRAAENLPNEHELTIQAEIGSSAFETELEDNFANVTSLVCDMAQSQKQVNKPEVKPGDVLTYTIQLRLKQRNGPENPQFRQVDMTDTLPFQHQVRFLGWVGPLSGTVEGNQLHWQGRVHAGEALTLRYRVGVEGDVEPGSVISNEATLAWERMRLRLGPVTTVVTMPHYAHMIGPQGHAWKHENGVTIEAPPDAVPELTRFEFQHMFVNGEPVKGPPGFMYAHRAFELKAFRFGEVHQFNQPISITIQLKAGELNGMEREMYRLWYRKGPEEPWKMLGEPKWLTEDTLAFTTDHFTQFALFGVGSYKMHLPIVIR